MITEKSKPTFSDFYISKLGYVSAKKDNSLKQGDYVLDRHGIAGQVRLVSEEFGNYIVFVDGHSAYDDNLELRRLSTAGVTVYNYQKLNFSLLTALARIMDETISEFYPYTFMYNDGSNLWVRGSTMNGIVDKFSQKNFSSNTHSLFSAKMNPRYTCEIETLTLKKPLLKTRFNFSLLKAMFVDVDIKMKGDSRIKWRITEGEEYNKKWWREFTKKYGKYDIKYMGDLNE